MSIQEVIDKLTVLSDLLPIFSEIDGYERYGKMLFPDKIEYLTTSLKISSEEAQEALNLIDSEMSELKLALLSLSQQDAKSVMDVAAQNEEYNEILGRLISGIDVSYRDKIALSRVYYTGEGDPATKLLDVMIEKATTPEKTLKGTFSPKILESKEFQDLREGVLHFFKPMKYLYKSKIVDDQFVGLGIDAFLLRKPNDLEAFSDELTKIISQSSEIDTFENIARIWEATLPDSYDIKLRKLSLSASDLEIQNSIRKVVALMGKDPTQIIQGADIIMTGGKKIEVKNNVGGFITIDGVAFFKDVTHVIHTSPELDQSTKDELEKLIERLTQELAQIPKEKAEEAETVAELTKDLVEKATKEKPNKPLVKITADGLLKAAENIEKIAPKVITIAKQIVALLLI